MKMSIIFPAILLYTILSSTHSILCDCDSCYMPHQYVVDHKFEQKNKRFWEFNHQSNTWVEVGLPYNLISCINTNCTVVDSIQEPSEKRAQVGVVSEESDMLEREERASYAVLPVRKRVSLTKMSETSVWITGESGSIYERFWNGLQWVIAPHDLPLSAGYAVSVFIINLTILALSEKGLLYQMQLSEEAEPIWVEFMPQFGKETVEDSVIQLSSGLVSNDRERMHFCSKNGLLLELVGVDPPRWENHGRPPGANVAAVSDGAMIRAGLLLIVSSAGNLYEYDQRSKPPWKKHIHGEGSKKDTSLALFGACTLHGLVGPHSVSVFLLTKGGGLVERRLHQRKWKWVVHGNPKGHQLTSITCPSQDDVSNNLFVTSSFGSVFEYPIQKYPEEDVEEKWVNHKHPPHAKAARGIAALRLQLGRMIFPLDDGRLAELHLSGHGGECVGPNAPTNSRKKTLLKYVWSLLDAPESEGWNAEYCTQEHGPSNCILGTKEETSEETPSMWRKDRRTQHSYLSPDGSLSGSGQDTVVPIKRNRRFFRLRLMQGGNSFFIITDNDVMFEYSNTENAWFWLMHQHSTGIEGALGNYNGSLFVVDENGSLLIRERSSGDLAWINCTAMRKGRQVIAGPPWDGMIGQPLRAAKPEDAIFFISTTGRLLQFTVALRKFKWKDCKNPTGVKIASIVDQEGFRENIVFVIGVNGRLYQYNKVTQVWHQHYQSQHLVLSTSPGTAMRVASMRGSLFMLSDDGGLVEYQWGPTDGWDWIEHGPPHTKVSLVGAPGPCFEGTQLFLIGSDGNVYLRYLDGGEWKWRDYGFPSVGSRVDSNGKHVEGGNKDKNCNPKVSPTRPIPFSQDTIIFELQDGRLGEMKRVEDKHWIWSRTIATPTSLCMAYIWTSWAS